MNPAEWCIKNNRTACVLFFLVALSGVSTYLSISRLEDPAFTIRTAMVVTPFPGASPQRVENLITDKLEKKIREIPEVERVSSQSKPGVSILYVDIDERYKDLKPIWDRLRTKVAESQGELPPEAGIPNVNDEFGDVYGIVVALTGDEFTYRELKDAADRGRDALLKMDDVAKVDLHGLQEERVYVEFSNARLAQSGVNPFMIAELLKAENIISPSGEARLDSERITLEATGEFELVDQIRQASIRIPGEPEAVTLGDISEVSRSYEDPPSAMMRFNGEKAILLAVNMAKGGNIVKLGEQVKRRIDQLTNDLPVGMDYHILCYQPKFVERSIRDFMINLAEAFFFVVVVMLFFTGWRMGLIAASLIPMAMLACIALLPLFHTDLQKISIAALIIALGMLVDNGVVVSESILVRLTDGQSRLAAIQEAVKELWIPLLAASATTIFAFLPIPLAQSVVGEYCFSLFVVISTTLIASWVLALTLVPMLCFYFLKPKRIPQKFDGAYYAFYRKTLLWSLKNRPKFLLSLLSLLVLSFIGFKFVPKIFFPPNDREMVVIDFWQPYGTDIRTTTERVEQLENLLIEQEIIESVGTFIGSGGPRWYLSLSPEQASPNYSFLVVNLDSEKYFDDPDIVDRLIKQASAFLDENFPDARHTVKKLESGPAVGAPIQIRISGSDVQTLYRLRNRIEQEISTIPGLVNSRDDWGEWIKKLEIQVKQEQAKRAGLTSQDIALSLQSQISGYEATQLREEDEIIPIVLRSRESIREDVGAIDSLNVYSYQSGRSLPLMQVAHSELVWQPANIRRRNQERTLTLKADIEGNHVASEILASIRPKIQSLQDSKDWPLHYSLEYGGESEESQKAQSSIMAGMPIAMGLILLVLIAQFNSARRTAIIACTIPPMLIGIVPGLLITRAAFGFMAMLGMISLMGIIVNNAIMLIDCIELERTAGRSMTDAIIISAQKRLRPIMSTAITTIIGLVPLSLQGGEFWRPMANTIMFGLAFSTVLTLALCPVLYSLFFRTSFSDYTWDAKIIDKT